MAGDRAKVRLRLNVLECVRPARVFDAFAGLGGMYLQAWSKAESYIGCDERDWSPSETHKRFVGDNRLVMRAVDLQRFNVFDLDADRSPWDQMWILLHRRTWAPGEVGAVVLTDGSAKQRTMGGSMARILGTKPATFPRATVEHARALHTLALKRWCQEANVAPRRLWQAAGKSKALFTACVFEGLGARD